MSLASFTCLTRSSAKGHPTRRSPGRSAAERKPHPTFVPAVHSTVGLGKRKPEATTGRRFREGGSRALVPGEGKFRGRLCPLLPDELSALRGSRERKRPCPAFPCRRAPVRASYPASLSCSVH